MKGTMHPYMKFTLCLAAVFLLALATGCTGSGTTAMADTPAPAVSPPDAVPVTRLSEPETIAAQPARTSAPAADGEHQTIRISGSTTVMPIVQKAADQYMAAHPEADIQVSG